MNKYYYKKSQVLNFRRIIRFCALGIFLIGISIVSYAFFPLLSWSLYFAPAFANQSVTIPIPKITVVRSADSLLTSTIRSLTTDYTNAENWFPNAPRKKSNSEIQSYFLSIPALQIRNAIVSTQDNDLGSHLVNFEGTAVPPQIGNAVIFGHSTLPQLFKPTDYKTIFANAYRLKIGNEIIVQISNVIYSYKIYSITIVDPEDTSIFSQEYDTSYVTLVTCTPPGTTWKRLIIRARIEKL